MALPLNNNAEGQGSGTTVTTANSGGGSGDAFDEAIIGANMTETFDNGQPAHGANAYKDALTSTATAITYLGWTSTSIGSAVVDLWGRVYIYANRVPATSTVRLIQFFNAATLIGTLGGPASGTGNFQFRGSGDTAIGTGSTAINANTLY